MPIRSGCQRCVSLTELSSSLFAGVLSDGGCTGCGNVLIGLSELLRSRPALQAATATAPARRVCSGYHLVIAVDSLGGQKSTHVTLGQLLGVGQLDLRNL